MTAQKLISGSRGKGKISDTKRMNDFILPVTCFISSITNISKCLPSTPGYNPHMTRTVGDIKMMY